MRKIGKKNMYVNLINLKKKECKFNNSYLGVSSLNNQLCNFYNGGFDFEIQEQVGIICEIGLIFYFDFYLGL